MRYHLLKLKLLVDPQERDLFELVNITINPQVFTTWDASMGRNHSHSPEVESWILAVISCFTPLVGANGILLCMGMWRGGEKRQLL